MLIERGRTTRDKGTNETKDDTPPIPPRQDIVINVISGGLEVSGVSYAAAKRSSRRILQTDTKKKLEHMI